MSITGCRSIVPPPPTIPAEAVAVGYNTLTFSSNFTAGDYAAKWNLWNFFGGTASASQVKLNQDGSVTLLGDITGPSGQICTARDAGGGTMTGLAFGGGAYFEADIQFDAGGSTAVANSWPAFWSMAIEHLVGMSADVPAGEHWPGQVANYNHFIELDFFEFDKPAGNISCYGGTVHDWSGVGNSTNITSDGLMPFPANTDLSQFHKYGALWVPATASTKGYITFYFDRAMVGRRVNWWNQYAGQAPSTPTTIFLPTRIDDSASWQGFNLRQIIPASQLGPPSGSGNIRVQVEVGVGSQGVLHSMWIGKRSGATNDFDGNQVQLKFDGQTSMTILSTWPTQWTTFESDPIAFPYDETVDMIVTAYFENNVGDQVNVRHESPTGCIALSKAGSDESGTTSVTGYFSESDTAYLIKRMTVEATGAYQSWSVIDVQHLPVILGSGTGWPMVVRSVNVWQTSAANNMTR